MRVNEEVEVVNINSKVALVSLGISNVHVDMASEVFFKIKLIYFWIL